MRPGGILAGSYLVFCSLAAWADGQSAEDAVTEVLWNYEDSFDYVQYNVTASGHVDMTFAANTPDALYSDIVSKVRHHRGVDSVLAGKGRNVCPLFP